MSDYERQVSITRPPTAWTSSPEDRLLVDHTHRSSKERTSLASATYDWRPRVMQGPYLIFIALLSIILAIIQECLCRKSSKHGSLLQFQQLSDMSVAQYILWRYVPPVTVVSYGIFVTILDNEIMRFAPYHKMIQHGGLKGADHIIRKPISQFWYVSHPSKAGSLVWVSSLGTLAASLFIPMAQSASLVSKHKDGQNYTVLIDAGWSRFLSIVLFINTGCVAALWIILRKPTELKECPYSIAGILSMFEPACFADLTTDLSVLSDKQMINQVFEKEKFILQHGAVTRCTAPDEPKRPVSTDRGTRRTRLKPLTCKPKTMGSSMITCLGIVLPLFFAVGSWARINTVPQMVPWLSTGIAALFKLICCQYEIFLRGIEPFGRLRNGDAPPGCLFDDYTGTPILLMPIRAFKHGSRLLAFQGFCSVLLEVWMIAVISFCDRSILLMKAGGSDFPNYTSSTMFSADFYITGIIGTVVPVITAVSAITVNFKTRRSYLPANPLTIVNLLLYTQGTKLRASLEQLQNLDPSSREHRLIEQGKRYTLGWFHDGTAGTSVYIDEEPRFAPYQHLDA